jgi:hypothetical protein
LALKRRRFYEIKRNLFGRCLRFNVRSGQAELQRKMGARSAAKRLRRLPPKQSQVNVIDHKEPKIKLTLTIKGDAIPGGEATNEREFTTDGKESTNKSGDRELKSVTKWDNDKLVTTVRLDTPDGAIEINDSWIVADAGKHMVVTGHFTGRTLLLARQGSPSRPSSAPLFSIHLGLALLGNS